MLALARTVPSELEDRHTKLTFQKCLGHEFTVTAINELGWAELQIEAITGTSGDLIYVSPSFLKIISTQVVTRLRTC
jgi:hypothetical protein